MSHSRKQEKSPPFDSSKYGGDGVVPDFGCRLYSYAKMPLQQIVAATIYRYNEPKKLTPITVTGMEHHDFIPWGEL